MATVNTASDANKQTVTLEKIQAVTSSLGVEILTRDLEDWHSLLASNQASIDIVESLPDYLPQVDLKRFPRKDVHRPEGRENEGNAWAWKVTIKGAVEGPLKGMRMALKDNIAVKDVPMLFGTDVFTDFVPDVDASKFPPSTGLIATDCQSRCDKITRSWSDHCWESSLRKSFTLCIIFLCSHWTCREPLCNRIFLRRFFKRMWASGWRWES